MNIDTLNKISNKVEIAISKWGDYKNHHEAYAILLEEIDELWDEVKKKEQNSQRIKEEIIDSIVVLIKWYENI